MTTATHRPAYVLPLRHDRDADLTELTAYLRWLSGRAEVVVVDGSAPRWFERHRRAWGGTWPCTSLPTRICGV
ncbi:hypothetical protein [Amycolatopsis sp. lyj-23]|uniref:hypothetical protein n=1 Tax=Amycolatopsis sp. lyj-23 TaxID=2789283 RepID=UPI00397B6701